MTATKTLPHPSFDRLTGVALPPEQLARLLEGDAAALPSGYSMREVTQRLKTVLALTQDETARLLGVSRSTVLKNGPPSVDVLDRLYALGRSLDVMTQVLGEHAPAWFRLPNPALSGARPLDKFRSRYGQEQVEQLIQGLLDGNFL